jgi:hypothetical protein
MTEPIVRTEPLGGSPLARAAMDGQLGDWYVQIPGSPQSWKARVESVRASVSRDWLDVLRRPLGSSALQQDAASW